jgi:hypothetical protein
MTAIPQKSVPVQRRGIGNTFGSSGTHRRGFRDDASGDQEQKFGVSGTHVRQNVAAVAALRWF